ncbi:lipocalin-like [Tachyglossus aculeatus]|uniref:lipocalin-like n=1 Tax=Tachyglossus aculeatus TaxID=9261 RepID=UPI0018F5E7AD|nr:lipocalin-like [Tachyglossus aculeatus]
MAIWLNVGLSLLCVLPTQAQSESPPAIPVQPNFRQDEFTGKWYSIGMASNSQWFKDKKHLMTTCVSIVSPVGDGNLNQTSTFPRNDRCEKRTMLLERTSQPGRFSYKSLRWGSDHEVRVVETNYDEYAVMFTTKSKGSGNFSMAILYGRSKDLRPELKKNFIEFAKSQGFTDDSIIFLPKTDKCMEETE